MKYIGVFYKESKPEGFYSNEYVKYYFVKVSENDPGFSCSGLHFHGVIFSDFDAINNPKTRDYALNRIRVPVSAPECG